MCISYDLGFFNIGGHFTIVAAIQNTAFITSRSNYEAILISYTNTTFVDT